MHTFCVNNVYLFIALLCNICNDLLESTFFYEFTISLNHISILRHNMADINNNELNSDTISNAFARTSDEIMVIISLFVLIWKNCIFSIEPN